MSKALVKTDFNFPGQKNVYHGKVRDVYNINDELLVMVASDRISAFDVVLPKGTSFIISVLLSNLVIVERTLTDPPLSPSLYLSTSIYPPV